MNEGRCFFIPAKNNIYALPETMYSTSLKGTITGTGIKSFSVEYGEHNKNKEDEWRTKMWKPF